MSNQTPPPRTSPHRDTSPHPPSKPQKPTLQITTYHCLCSNLILATTYSLQSLPRRATPALDKAYILPCPRLPRRRRRGTGKRRGSDGGGGEGEGEGPNANEPESGSESASGAESVDDDDGEDGGPGGPEPHGYTLLISLAAAPRQPPVLVRRSDGFEKRWAARCGRCGVVAGYWLDWAQFAAGLAVEDARGEVGRREDVLYLLPGAVMETGDMVAGRVAEGEEMGFGLG